MLLLSLGGEPPFHQALLADAGRVRQLGQALTRLRSELDRSPVMEFFAAHADGHERAEREVPLAISARKWKARLLEVKDFLGSKLPTDVKPRESADGYLIRKLGWVNLDRELSRARSLVRIGAAEPVLAGQRKRVLAAFRATSFEERHAPPPRRPPEFDFWITDGRDLEATTREQQAWSHAQELVERGLELCAPPLEEPIGLGGHASLELSGTPLIDESSAPHAAWVEPSWRPEYLIGRDALAVRGAIRPKPGADPSAAEAVAERLGRAAERASAAERALVWWIGPSG